MPLTPSTNAQVISDMGTFSFPMMDGETVVPVQVTDDLDSFWKRMYPEVRRQLRGRYPKHAWPESPLVAAPQTPRRV